MKVLKGGSAEVAPNKWFKFDVELDESDLQAIVIKHSIDYAALTVGDKYKLLAAQAEILVNIQFENEGLKGESSTFELLEKFNKLVASLPKVES